MKAVALTASVFALARSICSGHADPSHDVQLHHRRVVEAAGRDPDAHLPGRLPQGPALHLQVHRQERTANPT